MAILKLVLFTGSPIKPTMEITPISGDLHKLYLTTGTSSGTTFTFGFDANTSNYDIGTYVYFSGVAGKSVTVDWGDSTSTVFNFNNGIQYAMHTYSNVGATTYTCVMSGDVAYLRTFSCQNKRLILNFGNIPSTLTALLLNNINSNQVTGAFSSLPLGLQQLEINAVTGLNDTINNLPSNLTYLHLGTLGNNITGSINNLSQSLTDLLLASLPNVNGSISTLSPLLVNLQIINISLSTSGSIEDLSVHLQQLNITFNSPYNTLIKGSLGNLQSGVLADLSLSGMLIVDGDVGDFIYYNDLTNISLTHLSTTITGSIGHMPHNLTHLDLEYLGYNIVGSTDSLPGTLTTLICVSISTAMTGELSYLPSGLITLQLQDVGNGFTGDIGSLPSNLIVVTLIDVSTGSNIYGDLQYLPSPIKNLDLRNLGSGIFGSISSIPSGINYVRLDTLSATFGYTAGNTWASPMILISVLPPVTYGLTSTKVDNILIDAANSTWINGGYIYLNGNNAARTSASNTAVSTLTGYGVTVLTN